MRWNVDTESINAIGNDSVYRYLIGTFRNPPEETRPICYENKTDIIQVFEYKTLSTGPIELLNTVIIRYGIEHGMRAAVIRPVVDRCQPRL